MAREGYYAVDGDSNGITVEATDEKGAIHIHGVEDVGGLETVFFKGNYPAQMVLRHVDVEGKIERGPIDETPNIGIPTDKLSEFIDHCCQSDWPTTVDQSAVSRIKEVCQ